LFPCTASGRAIANGRDEGVTKLLFDDSAEEGSDGHAGPGHGKILGGGMVGTHAGDMIGEIALARMCRRCASNSTIQASTLTPNLYRFGVLCCLRYLQSVRYQQHKNG
jgi:pyruvate/2-oxoglutarate dehydrogenase complex dihydrolipoamide dehydrogenase (E3) component